MLGRAMGRPLCNRRQDKRIQKNDTPWIAHTIMLRWWREHGEGGKAICSASFFAPLRGIIYSATLHVFLQKKGTAVRGVIKLYAELSSSASCRFLTTVIICCTIGLS